MPGLILVANLIAECRTTPLRGGQLNRQKHKKKPLARKEEFL
jgi:hypothetical protein